MIKPPDIIEIPVEDILESDTLQALISFGCLNGVGVVVLVVCSLLLFFSIVQCIGDYRLLKQREKYIKAMEQKLELMFDEK